jgi:hypothetical protein
MNAFEGTIEEYGCEERHQGKGPDGGCLLRLEATNRRHSQHYDPMKGNP